MGRDRCWGWLLAAPEHVREWLGEQSENFQKMIKIVVIDPSAPYASGIRAALPDAKIAVDKWHLVVKERLRMLLAESEPSKIRWRLADFYHAVIDAQLPEATRLAETIQTWWPAILVALTEDASNARTEGFNRIIKQTKRVGCGYRNMINYERRILSHIAVTRPQESAA